MDDFLLAGREVALYADDSHELSVISPIGHELERRGAIVRTATSIHDAAEIGLYSAHTSRFFDFDAGGWRRPPNALSVQSLHDLGDDGADAEYFQREAWHIFDLGLLPGSEWQGKWERARLAGTRGPVLGMRVVGWPKMDHVYASSHDFACSVRTVREELGVADRPVLLLACSWSDRRQLRDTLSMVVPGTFDIVVKYPSSWLPSPESPWAQRLNDAYVEMRAARDEAIATSGVTVADDDADIMALLAVSDIVLSDGSNVLFEGILAGVPGICVKDWLHPAGRRGEQAVQPRLDLAGVISGKLASLPAMIRIVGEPAWASLVQDSADALVAPETRGSAAARAADAIADALRRHEPRSREAWSRRHPDIDIKVEHDDPLSVAVRQLKRTEADLEATREALKQADERESHARKQLAAWEQELAVLRAKAGETSAR